MVTWLQLCMAMRGIAEHFSIDPGRRVYGETRTTTPSMLDALFVVPRNIGYHIEHHLHPFIPYYALPECHREYLGLTAFRERAHVTKGYWGVVKECVQRN
jgi:fatty acid desaturase